MKNAVIDSKIDISHKPIGQFEETRFEKIHNVIFQDSNEASIQVAHEIAALIKKRQGQKRNCVLGLATGSSPIRVYEELVRMHKEEGLSFKNVITFNLDEYLPMEPNNIQSYFYFMHEHLFNHVDIPEKNIHIPDGTVSNEETTAYCLSYERKIKEHGGLDFHLNDTVSRGQAFHATGVSDQYRGTIFHHLFCNGPRELHRAIRI